jgi:hypothetical protein
MSNKTLSQQIGQTAGAAAGTAVAPIIGTAIGGAVGNMIGGIFGGGGTGRSWANAGPGVHDWFTKYGEEAFLQWMRTNHPDKFGDLDTVKGLRYVWTFTGPDNGLINNLDNPNYRLPKEKEIALWRSMGVDIDASRAAQAAAGGNPNNVPANRVVRISPTPAAVDELSSINAKASRGEALTPAEQQALNALKKGAGGSFDLGSLMPLLLIVLGVWIVSKFA